MNYSTVKTILDNRAYLGEMRHKDLWLPSNHDALITEEAWHAAHRGRTKGVKRGNDLLSGRVHCGICNRRMSIEGNGHGQRLYRCKHRGEGCAQPARSNRGLIAAFVLALELLRDGELQEAIRKDLTGRRQPGGARRRGTTGSAKHLDKLRSQRDKLLALYYDDKISADQFGQEQARITAEIENLEAESIAAAQATTEADDLLERFDEVATLLDSVDLSDLWDEADETERRVLVDELLHSVTIHPDRLQVAVHGAPPLNVAFQAVGLKPPPASADSANTRKAKKPAPMGRTLSFVVSEGGLEPPHPYGHQILSLARLPIPPLRRGGASMRRPTS